jgi:uncharacterized protein (UPF0335 family)
MNTQQYPLPVNEVKPVSNTIIITDAMPSQTPTPAPTSTPTCMDLVLAPGSESHTVALTQPSVTKEQLKDYLRQWVRIENEISTLSAEIKKRKLIHQQLSKSLLDVMRKDEIDCFDIANGRIVYSKTKVRAPLNNGQLKTALTTYYKDDADKATNLTTFLLESRVEKTRESIKMKIPKIK